MHTAVSILAPSGASLQPRSDAGCHNGVALWREVQALGFPGIRRMGSNCVVLRRALWRSRPSASGRRPAAPKAPVVRMLPASTAKAGYQLPAPRQLVWLLVRPQEALTPSARQRLQSLHRDKELATA
jgi:hypothetical protein